MDKEKELHLTFVQNTITRLANNSSQIKTWAISIIGALFTAFCALESRIETNILFMLSIGLLLAFYFLDVYYLWMEKEYRELYNKIINNKPVKSLTMNPGLPKCKKAVLLWESVKSISTFGFYFVLLGLIILLIHIV